MARSGGDGVAATEATPVRCPLMTPLKNLLMSESEPEHLLMVLEQSAAVPENEISNISRFVPMKLHYCYSEVSELDPI